MRAGSTRTCASRASRRSLQRCQARMRRHAEGCCSQAVPAMRSVASHCGRRTTTIAEVKRLYVQPRARGEHWGRRLASLVIEEARRIGYRELKLDTLQRMTQARHLYESLGFVECAPYYHNPLGAPVYMQLDL